MKFMLPFYQEFQDQIKQMVLNPMPIMSIEIWNRQTIALVGSNHIYSQTGDVWDFSCSAMSPEMPRLLFSFGGVACWRYPDGDVWIKGLYEDGMLFNGTGIFMQYGDGVNDPESLKSILTARDEGFSGAPMHWLLDTNDVTHFIFMLPPAGLIVSLENPSGSNWVIFLRAALATLELGFGSMPKGCGSIGTDAKSDASMLASSGSVSQSCITLCAAISTLNDACESDCSAGMRGMPDELTVLTEFHLEAIKRDRTLTNMALNGDRYGLSFAPCSVEGFIYHSGLRCTYSSMSSAMTPLLNFTEETAITDVLKDIGIIEPYAIYGMSALINEFVVGPPVRQFMNLSASDVTSFVATSVMTTVMAKHCRFVAELSLCLEYSISQHCPRIEEEVVNSYLAPLASRYCVALDTTSPQIKQNVLDEMIAARDDLMNEVSCVVNGGNTQMLEFNETKLGLIFSEMLDRCEFEDVYLFAMHLGSSDQGIFLQTIRELIRIAKAPMRCIVKVVEGHCTGIDINALVDKLVVHLNRATAGVLGIDRDFFINSKQINYGSKERVSLWAVGDPHIRSLDSDQFTVCDSPGNVTYFSSEEGARFEMKALNDPAYNSTTATVIREIYVRAWAPGAAFTAAPMISYSVKNGVLATTFDDGETNVVVGDFSIFMEMRHNGKTAFIQNVNSGTFVAIQKFKTYFNMVLRTSRSYAETGTGLMVAGCGLEAKNVTLLNEDTVSGASSRKKRAVSMEECQVACASVSAMLQEQCKYDCLTLEDTEVGQALSSVVEVEAEVMVEDSQIEIWLPDLDAVTTEAAANMVIPNSLLVVLATVLLW